MKIVKQFAIILLFLYFGYLTERIFNIPVPANVIGMVFLFLALITKVVKLEKVEDASNFVIQYLAVFYLVPSVGIILYLDLLKNEFIKIIIPVFISIILGLLVAGKVTELLMGRGNHDD